MVKNSSMISGSITVRLAAALAVTLATPLAAQTITKCQDAEGRWHYGNYASEQCAGDAPITELRESGVTVEVREAPPTLEELQAEKTRALAEREAQIKREEKLRIDRELLAKYESEEVILSLRDQRIQELRKQIDFNSSQLAVLEAQLAAAPQPTNEVEEQERHEDRQRIDRFRRAIDRASAAIDKTNSDYQVLLERYRQIETRRAPSGG